MQLCIVITTAVVLFVRFSSRFLNVTNMTSWRYSRMSMIVSLPAGTACTYRASLAVPLTSNPTLIALAAQLSAAAAVATGLELLLCALEIKKAHAI